MNECKSRESKDVSSKPHSNIQLNFNLKFEKAEIPNYFHCEFNSLPKKSCDICPSTRGAGGGRLKETDEKKNDNDHEIAAAADGDDENGDRDTDGDR